MPTTKVIKPKPKPKPAVEATRKAADRSNPRAPRATEPASGALALPSARKARASSCPRCPQTARSVAAAAAAAKAQGATNGSGCPRRARSTSATRLTPAESRHPAREQRGSHHSHKAFTVIPPNPKKRREIQRKAEAELAALEELRLSRAMAYVSISPSSVGGCLSLEEVRLKQQQEMMLAKRKPKPIKQQVMEETPVPTS